MYYFKQINEDDSVFYLVFSFSPIVSENMTAITQEEYENAIAPQLEVVELTPNEEIEGQTEICFN